MKAIIPTRIPALLIVSLFFTVISAVCFSQDMANVSITTHKVTNNIYMLQGQGGNIGVLVGGDGTIIIDDQFAPLTEKIKTAISEINEHPTQFVLNTHWHYDHTDGNENFGKAGAIIVSQANSRSRMATDQILGMMGRKQEAYEYAGLPKITFEESMTFHYNGETLNAFHVGPAHTDGDAIVHFVESNVFHTGDVFVRYGLPFIDQPNGGNVEGMIKFVDAVIALADENTKIIPGHGQIASKQDLINYRNMLQSITDQIKTLMDRGMSLEQITDAKPLNEYPARGFVTPDAFVKIVFDSINANR